MSPRSEVHGHTGAASRDSVLFLAIACQEMNEALRRKAEDADEVGVFAELAYELIRVVKVGVRCFSAASGAATAAGRAAAAAAGEGLDLSELAATLECVRSTCQDIQDQTCNYFGAFRKGA